MVLISAKSPCLLLIILVKLSMPFSFLLSLILQLKLEGVTSYFNVHSKNIEEYDKNDLPKIQITVEELLYDPPQEEYSARKIQMMDHWG